MQHRRIPCHETNEVPVVLDYWLSRNQSQETALRFELLPQFKLFLETIELGDSFLVFHGTR